MKTRLPVPRREEKMKANKLVPFALTILILTSAAFAGNTPWFHVDIAGTFWNDGSGTSYNTKGATGYGVDLAVEYLRAVADTY